MLLAFGRITSTNLLHSSITVVFNGSKLRIQQTYTMTTSAPTPTTTTTSTTTNTPPDSALRQANQTSFSRDLEFLSSLANPYYLNHLALSGVLSSPAFKRYLKYLDYFRHPKYVKYLQYPQALHFLDLLQNEEEFRLALRDPGFVGEIMAKQIGHWATWRDTNDKEDEEAEEQGGEGQQEAQKTW